MLHRRRFLGSLGTAGPVSIAGCNDPTGTASDPPDEPTTSENTPAESVVATYYRTAANGELERATDLPALTELDEEDGSIAQVTAENTDWSRGSVRRHLVTLREHGMVEYYDEEGGIYQRSEAGRK